MFIFANNESRGYSCPFHRPTPPLCTIVISLCRCRYCIAWLLKSNSVGRGELMVHLPTRLELEWTTQLLDLGYRCSHRGDKRPTANIGASLLEGRKSVMRTRRPGQQVHEEIQFTGWFTTEMPGYSLGSESPGIRADTLSASSRSHIEGMQLKLFPQSASLFQHTYSAPAQRRVCVYIFVFITSSDGDDNPPRAKRSRHSLVLVNNTELLQELVTEGLASDVPSSIDPDIVQSDSDEELLDFCGSEIEEPTTSQTTMMLTTLVKIRHQKMKIIFCLEAVHQTQPLRN
ncbi:hypothetical protein J6590_101984 [Homalodisca vitripennis]|nr:hypothetical protein J6590_101984 [Homalodisca vitripennis]